MVRCTEFYERWKRHPNFCEKSPAVVRRIDHYLTLVEDLESTGIDQELTFANFSEGAHRLLSEVKNNPTVYNKVLDNIAGRLKNGRQVTARDVKYWIDFEHGGGCSRPESNSIPTRKKHVLLSTYDQIHTPGSKSRIRLLKSAILTSGQMNILIDVMEVFHKEDELQALNLLFTWAAERVESERGRSA